MSINETLDPRPLPIPGTEQPENGLIFMGGMGYDQLRNVSIGGAIIGLTGHQDVISIPDETPGGPKDGTFVFAYADGSEVEMPGKRALKNLDDESTARFARLHEKRAQELIATIENSGGKPVDAVFQSVDVSTGILAMKARPDLFKEVILLDPSSIIKLPPRRQFLKEEWKNGNLQRMVKQKTAPAEVDKFEAKATPLEKHLRLKRSNRNGNQNASYISHQATMLHEIAISENAPTITIVASQFDHAYSPERLLEALVSLDDVNTFFITNTRHGLAGKKSKLQTLVGAFGTAKDRVTPFIDRLHFAEGIPDDYRQKILGIVTARQARDQANNESVV